MAGVNPNDLLPGWIIARGGHVENKGLLAGMLGHRPGVERVCRVIGFSVPIEESSCGHLQLSGRDDSPQDLNHVAP